MNKAYETKGMMLLKDKLFPNMPLLVQVTNDETGCTVSIGCEDVYINFTVAFDQMLKDLKGEE